MKKMLCGLIGLTAALNSEIWNINDSFATKVDEHGFWIGEDAGDKHYFDDRLSLALSQFFIAEQAGSVVDFGCGMGNYTKVFLENGINADAFDGNPNTPELTNGIGRVLDLSLPFDLGKQYDWVLSLEVGEHLPKIYEENFIANLQRHAAKGIILSWAVKGQPGFGHVNCQDNDYIKAIFEESGYINDLELENFLRKNAGLHWFRNTLMVFRKP